MARSGVTYHDVAQAAACIRDQGRNPTVDRVLAQLGTGSKSTLAPLLKQWKSQQLGEAAAAALPADVVAAVKALYEQLQQRAEHSVAQAREEFDALAAELRDRLSQATAEIDVLHADKQTLQDRLQTLEADNAELAFKFEQARLEAATRGVEVTEVRAQLHDAKTIAGQRVHELHQAQTHFEHYQAQMAEERQRERDQCRYNQQQLEGRVQALTNHLDHERARGNILEAAKQGAIQENAQLRQSLDQAQQDHQAMLLKATRNEETITNLAAAKATLEARIGTLEAQHEALSGTQAERDTAHRLIEQQVAKTSDELRRLNSENKHLLQEKARLEGQLKQLQRGG
jgi:chromosome segregation ATPase